jgi:RNA polymerase sigma factor (sigma-70 family)
VPATDSTAAIEAVYRIEFPRVVATLARTVGDIGLAEDLAQEALVDALRQWPRDGTPANPGAWLTAVGKRKAIDRFRRDRALAAKYAQVGRALETEGQADMDAVADVESADEIQDDQLRLIFVACHPLLAVPARVALTLRLVGGLTVPEIARAYVVAEPTIAQRIVRAKKAIAKAGVPFEVPTGDDRAARVGAVLEVIYLIFNEGYSATSGEDWLRPTLCAEALRLGRVLSSLTPEEAEVHALVALMEFHSSRVRARTGPTGAPVLLLDQDRRTWDRLLINRGNAALARAEALSETKGPYALQAAIAACHARSFRPEETDWAEVVTLYGELARRAPSPIVELNRAVAISMASGPGPALDLVDQLVETRTLERYHLLYSVRGDLLDKLGRHTEAAAEFERAARLATNGPERDLSSQRARASRARADEGTTGVRTVMDSDQRTDGTSGRRASPRW